MTRTILPISCVLLAAFLIVACGGDPETPPPSPQNDMKVTGGDQKVLPNPPEEPMLEGKEAIARGSKLFRDYKCVTCHKTKGFVPSSGPVLTKVGRKLTTEKMTTWIVNPKAIKPKTTMPAFAGPQRDLQYIVKYLETLR